MARFNDYRKTGLAIAAIILICDLITKQFFQNLLFDPPRSIEILPFFNLTAVWNKGVSFGLMAGTQIWHLLAIAAAITVIIIHWLWRAEDRFTAGGCGLILGGAIGNIHDRIQFGAVRDFFDFYIGSYHWPAFNIADSAVFIGVIFLLFSTVKRPDKIAS
ncbi:MAG: signal peptidase II [Alphaproteobacteria bacterium]|nr:MAG: signal peptidase II [Alphaproteobacteria bacterium]